MKNIDRIRNMNAEELAKFICDLIGYDYEGSCACCPAGNLQCGECEKTINDWLESEVEEDDRT